MQNKFKADLCPPNTIRRLKIAKTPAKVLDDFIVPDGHVDEDDGEEEDSTHNRSVDGELDAESRASLPVQIEDPFTMSFEWLENEIFRGMTDQSPTPAFDEYLDLLLDEVEVKVASGSPHMETLYVK